MQLSDSLRLSIYDDSCTGAISQQYTCKSVSEYRSGPEIVWNLAGYNVRADSPADRIARDLCHGYPAGI